MTKPNYLEDKYVDFDEETGLWCVFGVDSGFAYSADSGEEQAEKRLAEMKTNRPDEWTHSKELGLARVEIEEIDRD